MASAQPGADRDDEHGRDRRPDHRERRALHREQHVGGLQLLARHQLRHDAGHRGEADGAARAVDGGQADQLPELRRCRSSTSAAMAPWVSAGADVGDPQDQGAVERGRRSRRRPAGRPTTGCSAARTAPARSASRYLEHGEGQRDGGHRRAEEVDQPRGSTSGSRPRRGASASGAQRAAEVRAAPLVEARIPRRRRRCASRTVWPVRSRSRAASSWSRVAALTAFLVAACARGAPGASRRTILSTSAGTPRRGRRG